MKNQLVYEHYQYLLSEHYSWLVGTAEMGLREGERWLRAQGFLNKTKVLDLGCGFGAYALPMARQGGHVTAIDFSENLLKELKDLGQNLQLQHSLEILKGDFTDYIKSTQQTFDLVLCLGDTLTHLESTELLEECVHSIANRLEKNGHLAITYRDYVTRVLKGDERFIQVRSEKDKMWTCFIEESSPSVVTIYDILHEKVGDQMQMKVSHYPKLRIHPELLQSLGQKNGLSLVKSETMYGRITQIFVKECE